MKTYTYFSSLGQSAILNPDHFTLELLREMDAMDEVGLVQNGKRVLWTRPAGEHSWLHTCINLRGRVEEQIEEHRIGDRVWVVTGGKDYVDHCTWVNAPILLPIAEAREELLQVLRNNDCECSYWAEAISPGRAKAIGPNHRDHIMEAYEDGHAHSVSYA